MSTSPSAFEHMTCTVVILDGCIIVLVYKSATQKKGVLWWLKEHWGQRLCGPGAHFAVHWCPRMDYGKAGGRERERRRNREGGRPVTHTPPSDPVTWPLSLGTTSSGHGMERNAPRESSRFRHVEVVIRRWPPLFSQFCFFTSHTVHPLSPFFL